MTRQSKRIADNVKKARKKIPGLTQEALAQEAKVSVRTISRLEQGKTEYPRPEEFERIAAVLLTTTDELRGIPEDGEPIPLEPRIESESDDQAIVQRHLESRYGEDAHFVAQVLDRLAIEPKPRRQTILGLLLGGIGDALGRPPLVRERQLTH